jgi:diguanylate cyclase (GGDEF)-like protein
MTAATLPESDVGRETIHALLIEDNLLDADLCLRALKRAGMKITSLIVEDEAALRAALKTFVPDVVLCDFSLPGFDGFAAQRVVQDAYPECPLIFVSGAISEERAALALQSGAVDYVMKSSLIRLPIAVQRAVRTARIATQRTKRAIWHAQRLDAFWRTATDPELRGGEVLHAMLREAAEGSSSQQPFHGFFCWRDDDGKLRVLCSAGMHDGCPSDREKIALTALGEPGRMSGASRWDDVTLDPAAPAAFAAAGWRSVASSQFDVAGMTCWLTFASMEAVAGGFQSDDLAYMSVLVSSFAHQVQVDSLEASLRDNEDRLRRHALRLEASWEIANDPALDDVDRWRALLAQAAGSMWPDQGFRGTFWRVDGDEMICEAVGTAPNSFLSHQTIKIGAVLPIAASPAGRVVALGTGTLSWDDVQASDPDLTLAKASGTRACIVTVFKTGSSSWVLSFGSGRVTSKPLGPLERSYVEVIASFFASHVQARWQYGRLQYQQSHDPLTGLLNREHFRLRAGELAEDSGRYATVLIDIDSFHEVNESYGHTVGDAVIVEVGAALSSLALADEFIGRVGGDVFAVYVPAPISPEFLTARVRSYTRAFSKSFAGGNKGATDGITRSASVGVAVAPADGDDFERVFSRADAALAVATERGNATVWYEAGMEDVAYVRATLRTDLADALAKDQFALYYQPHVDIRTGRVTGCEALIRWNHPTRGLVAPGEFIPFAEEVGIIRGIDRWVMREAFAAASALSAERPDFRLYFNFSGRQMGDPAIVRTFVNAARLGVPLKNIGVEITETDAMRNVRATHRVCRALRKLGVQIAIDDFGTGYSSLSSLKMLAVDVVKIDMSFIVGVTTDSNDAAITRTMISIADQFGFQTLGEGAETLDVVEWLRSNGCGYVQGYAVARPMPLDAFNVWLAANHPVWSDASNQPIRFAERRRRVERRAAVPNQSP